MAGSAALLIAGAGILGAEFWPRENPAEATAAVPGAECRMTAIPPAAETADAIQSFGESIARDVQAYGEAAKDPGVNHEELVAEAKTKIDPQRQRLDELVADGLDLIYGKTESPHTAYIMLRPCVMGK